jgi:multiple sugar transport system permease protein
MRRMGWFYVSMALILCAWVLLPIYLLTILSFTERQEVFAWPKTLWPQTLSFETLRFFFGVQGVWKALGNSVLVASLTVVFALALGAPAGYALARYKFPGKDAYRVLILITRAFPIMILAVPLAVRFIDLGIYDTPFAVALVHTALALPFAALITSSIFLGIPRELEEAAWTLGCTRWQAVWKLVLPLALPGLVATAIFAFVISWNEVFAATILTLRERTLTAYLLSVLNDSPLPFRFAGGFFLIVPALLFIFTIRKYLFTLWGIANR